MSIPVVMPQMGESIAEGTIVRWFKHVGDTIERDEPLFEISTDKVDAEIPAPTAGVLTEIKVQEGETVPVNSVVAMIGQPGEATTASPGDPHLKADAPAPTPQPAPARSLRSSPFVRRMASEHQVDISQIPGTGIGGRVTKHDMLKHLGRSQSDEPITTSAPAKGQPAAGPTFKPGELVKVVPMSVMRRKIAEHMVLSRRTSAHVHSVFEVNFTRVAQLLEEKRAEYEREGAKLTYLSFIARAAVDALREVTIINASVDSDAIVYKRDINLGIAVALDEGLIVPVIKNAHERNLLGLSKAITDVAARARAKRLTPEDVQEGTFTITNPGVFGAVFGMPIINQPQVAILGVGAVEKRPVVIGDAMAIRRMAYLTLGYDHRIIDGAVADRFMAKLKGILENFKDD